MQSRGLMKLEADTGVMWPQARNPWDPEARRGRQDSPLGPEGGAQPCQHPEQGLQPPEMGESPFLRHSDPSVQSFVTAAPGCEYRPQDPI